jgi:hypothetical protein
VVSKISDWLILNTNHSWRVKSISVVWIFGEDRDVIRLRKHDIDFNILLRDEVI